MILPIHGITAYWLHAPVDEAAAGLRVAPSLIYAGREPLSVPITRLVRPHDSLGNPQDHRSLVVTPAVLPCDDPYY